MASGVALGARGCLDISALLGWLNEEGVLTEELPERSYGSRAYTISWAPIYSIDLPVDGGYGDTNTATLLIDASSGRMGTSLGVDADKVTTMNIRSATPVGREAIARALDKIVDPSLKRLTTIVWTVDALDRR